MKIDELNALLNVSYVKLFPDDTVWIESKNNGLEYGYIDINNPSKFELGGLAEILSIEFLEDVIKVMKKIMSDQDVKLAEGGK